MTPKDIEILAHDNRPMPEFSALTDICLYQAFANLYNRLETDCPGPGEDREETDTKNLCADKIRE